MKKRTCFSVPDCSNSLCWVTIGTGGRETTRFLNGGIDRKPIPLPTPSNLLFFTIPGRINPSGQSSCFSSTNDGIAVESNWNDLIGEEGNECELDELETVGLFTGLFKIPISFKSIHDQTSIHFLPIILAVASVFGSTGISFVS